jgi:hypothetical protein
MADVKAAHRGRRRNPRCCPRAADIREIFLCLPVLIARFTPFDAAFDVAKYSQNSPQM